MAGATLTTNGSTRTTMANQAATATITPSGSVVPIHNIHGGHDWIEDYLNPQQR